jgi:putative redox protein
MLHEDKMVEINIEYIGDLHCKVTHAPSGQSFITDAPVDNNGKGEYISPTDLAAASIGSCIATIMGIRAKNSNIDIKGLKINVLKHMQDKPYRRIKQLIVKIQFPHKLNDKEFRILSEVVKICPVTKSLKEEIEVIPEFSFREN